jgi:hypothetical protein
MSTNILGDGEITAPDFKRSGWTGSYPVMLFFTIVAVFVISAVAAVSTTRALLKFMFFALAHSGKEELKPRG